MSRRRLIHVTTTDISLELLLGPQLRAFRDAGCEVIGMSAPGPFAERLTQHGIRHVVLRHSTRAMAPAEDARLLAELRRQFVTLRPDIVHTHNPKPGVFGRLAAKAARVPVIVNTVHGLYATPDDPTARKAMVYGLERMAAACSDAELVQNPEDVQVLRRLKVPSRRIHLLGNGIDLTRFDPANIDAATRQRVRNEMGAQDSDVVCGVVGRLVWEKGYREVLAAAAVLHKSAPHVRVVIVGPEDPDKADGVRPSELRDVAWLGHRDDMPAVYAAMDLYVLASYREGFPRSAMEAAAMSVPVIATDIRGCRQVVDDGTTGWLVPVRDTGALVGAITALANAPEMRARMGTAARAKAKEEFDQQRVIDLTLRVYDELLARKGR